MNLDEEKLRKKYQTILPHLNEKQKRIFLSAESEYFGRGGIVKVSKISGISRVTIAKGIKEILNKDVNLSTGTRKKGGGRKKEVFKQPDIEKALERLMEPVTRGEPESPLLWTSKSLRNLSEELEKNNLKISRNIISRILKSKGYSLQANRKTHEGSKHPDRDLQFQFINNKVKKFQQEEMPVISVDGKKKEQIGNFKNDGREWLKKGEAEEVDVYDFPSNAEGKGIPYGVYDIINNKGWVSVGTTFDTSEFAVSTIQSWWTTMGSEIFPSANKLLITADGGGSNGSRVRLWKKEIQRFANEAKLEISICHFPPGTSKWNKIEHRLFSFITKNWRGKPLVSYEVVVNLIASTKTSKGLQVKCILDKKDYKKGIKISDKEFNKINLIKDEFHGEWNYKISPYL